MNLIESPDVIQFAGDPSNAEDIRTLSLEVGGYDLRALGELEIPYVVDDAFLQRKSGIFGFALLEKTDHLGLRKI